MDARLAETLGPALSLEEMDALFGDIARKESGPERHGAALEPVGEQDTEYAIETARRWLVDEAPAAVQGKRNSVAYRVACEVKDRGVTEPTALGLMLEHWNYEKVDPPLDDSEVEACVASAFKTGVKAPGCANAEAEFDPVPGVEDGPQYDRRKKRPKLKGCDFGDLGEFDPSCHYLIKGLLDARTLAVLYGAPGAGKTFVALAMALAIAMGRQCQGRRVKRGLVVYVALEGPVGFTRRAWAARKELGLSAEQAAALPLHVISNRFDIRSKNYVEALIEDARAAEKRFGQGCALVIIDTLAKAAPGFDENAFQGMSEVIDSAERLQKELGCTVLLVHHSGKNAQQGARGHSALKGAVDTEIQVSKGAGAVRVLKIAKQRDGEDGREIKFKLKRVPLGEDADGDPVSSCVVEWITADEFDQVPLSPAAQEACGAFQIAAEDKTPEGRDWRTAEVTVREWEEAWIALRKEAGSPVIGPRRLRQIRQEVKECGFLMENDVGNWIAALDAAER